MKRKEGHIPVRSHHFQLILVSLFFASSFFLGQETEKSEKQKKEPLSQASTIWLEEVVPYIINDVEKEIFINLPTEIDRGKFIENFWRKRDPDPSTPENEFKLEYYKRIAIANKFFGSSGINGWRSDRGKIFILLGPPNEIQRDLNPTDSFSSVFHGPREIWNYWDPSNPRLPYNIEFVFVDKLGTGFYVLEQSLKLGQTGQGSALDIDSIHYQFDYMENIAEAMKNPFDKLEKLRGIVTTQVSYDLIPFSYNLFFLKGHDSKSLVPVVVEIPYSSLPQKNIEGEFYISLTLLATASTDLGQIVYERKKDINFKKTSSAMDSLKDDSFRLQFDLYLEPYVSRIDLLVLDNFSGKIGTSRKQISIPQYGSVELGLSDIILSSNPFHIESWNTQKNKNEIQEKKILTEIKQSFQNRQEMNAYFEVYNLFLNPDTGLNNLQLEYSFWQNGKLLMHNSSVMEEQTQEKDIIIQISFKLKNFKPGEYVFRTKVTDMNIGKIVSKDIQFQVTQ